MSTTVDARIVELEKTSQRDPDGLLDADQMQALAYLYEHAHGDMPDVQWKRRRALRPMEAVA